MGWRETAKLITDSSLVRDSSPILQGPRAWKAAAKEVTTPPRLQGKQQAPAKFFTALSNDYKQIQVSNYFRESKWMKVLEAMASSGEGLERYDTWRLTLAALKERYNTLVERGEVQQEVKDLWLRFHYGYSYPEDSIYAALNPEIGVVSPLAHSPVRLLASIPATFSRSINGIRDDYFDNANYYFLITDLGIAYTLFRELYYVYSSVKLLPTNGVEPEKQSGENIKNFRTHIKKDMSLRLLKTDPDDESSDSKYWAELMKKDLKTFAVEYIDDAYSSYSDSLARPLEDHDSLDHLVFVSLEETEVFYTHYAEDSEAEQKLKDNYVNYLDVKLKMIRNIAIFGKKYANFGNVEHLSWRMMYTAKEVEKEIEKKWGDDPTIEATLKKFHQFPEYELKDRDYTK